MDWDYYYWNIIYTDFIIHKHINYRLNYNDTKSLFNNKCYRQGGQSPGRFSLAMKELWGSITTEEQAEICR